MKEFKSVEDIVDFAIGEEEQAAAFYRELAEKVKHTWMKDVLKQFAREEDGHKTKLLKVKEGNLSLSSEKQVVDLKIGDYLVDAKVSGDMDYQDALIVAMKKEKSAFRLYSDLAAKSENEETREIFLALAQEEAKHKLRIEIEYDDTYMPEN